MNAFKKYKPYPLVHLAQREWSNNIITSAPIWCSTDLRDGNQALVAPMNAQKKRAYFEALIRMGFKEIEVAYPSASKAEFDFCRMLIEENLSPMMFASAFWFHRLRNTFVAVLKR